MPYNKKALNLHKQKKGKIEIKSKVPARTAEDLATIYTPGVGAVSAAISRKRNLSWEMTNRGNTVAIVTDGSAVLGLGNIGPRAALPVMEGKAVIFKKFADIDAYPLCIDTMDVDEIIKFCKFLEPSIGGINLEDISAPRCFEILEKLEKECDLAVFHDDQDGTAIVILAALINACRVTGKVLNELRYVVNGSGAAGIATTRLLLAHGVKDIILVDSIGALHQGRKYMNKYKQLISQKTNKQKIKGRLENAIVGADVFIGLSKGNLLSKRMVRRMNEDPIILALANPIPEIMPENAYAAGAKIVGTGRSDFPNQVNNALVFPGVFRGLLDGWKRKLTIRMKIAAATAIAYSVKPTKYKILPKVTDKKVVTGVAKAIMKKTKG
jgi:malate dehydrogenase (oxaloacetate-decarboxylating)